MCRLITCVLILFPFMNAWTAEENFLLINGVTGEVVHEMGSHLHEPASPCSTFKIVLSLMGYDAAILKDEETPTWNYQDGYDDYLESWRAPQTPLSWMKRSCLWYSRMIALQLGSETMQGYLAAFEYGNQDMSGGLTTAWIESSLKITPKEQVYFLEKMIREELPVSAHSIKMTKSLLFIEELSDGWRLFGKTGWGFSDDHSDSAVEVGWFVGWIEKDRYFLPFAYRIYFPTEDRQESLAQRIPRAKELLVHRVIQCTCSTYPEVLGEEPRLGIGAPLFHTP